MLFKREQSNPPPLTAEGLQEELRRFATEILQPELARTSARIEDNVRVEFQEVLESRLQAAPPSAAEPKKKSRNKRSSMDALAASCSPARAATALASGRPPRASILVDSAPRGPRSMRFPDDLRCEDMGFGCRSSGLMDCAPRGPRKTMVSPVALRMEREPEMQKMEMETASGWKQSKARLSFSEEEDDASDRETLVSYSRRDLYLGDDDCIASERVALCPKTGVICDQPHEPQYAKLTDSEGDGCSDEEAKVAVEDEDEEETSLRTFVDHRFFDASCTALVVANIVAMGVEADGALRNGGVEKRIFIALDGLFCVAFAVELTLRIMAYGYEFFHGEKRMWNVFDMVLVIIQIMNAFARTLVGSGCSFARVLYVVKNARILRVVRMIRFVSELRVLIIVIGGALRATLWTLLLLFILTYSFSLVIMLVIKDRIELDPYSADEYVMVDLYFGSLTRTMWTLYLAISSGVTWGDGQGPAPTLYAYVSPWTLPVFGLYVGFMVFGVLNIITGIYLNTAISTTDEINHNSMMDQIRHLFAAADTDGSGTVNLAEFKSLLTHKEMGVYLRGIGWRVEQAEDLFRMLDDDGSGEISIDEFIAGCTRLQGPARAIDFAAFVASFNRLQDRLFDHMDMVEMCPALWELSEQGDDDGPPCRRLPGALPGNLPGVHRLLDVPGVPRGRL